MKSESEEKLSRYKTVGAVIGRFQIDDLHDGHRALLDYVQECHHRMLILVGVRPTRANKNNPLTFDARRHMLNKLYPQATVLPIVDQASDVAWSQRVDEAVAASFGLAPVIFYCGREGFAKHYSGRYRVEEKSFTGEKHSSTEQRWKLQATTLQTPDFRAGVIHAIMGQPDFVECIADMAVFKDNHKSVLLIQKPYADDWGFPGGFASPKDDVDLEATATRELKEETGIIVETNKWRYEGNFFIDDWRRKGIEGHHFHTTLFSTLLPWSATPKAADDVVDAQWFDLDKLPKIAPVHIPLFKRLQLID